MAILKPQITKQTDRSVSSDWDNIVALGLILRRGNFRTYCEYIPDRIPMTLHRVVSCASRNNSYSRDFRVAHLQHNHDISVTNKFSQLNDFG